MLKSCIFLVSTFRGLPPCRSADLPARIGQLRPEIRRYPSRSMAQGLVKPTSPGSDSFHGGLDLSHNSGLYFGQFSPNMGPVFGKHPRSQTPTWASNTPFDQTLGYEVGLIHYSYPKLSPLDSQEFYGGLNLLGDRFGASFRQRPGPPGQHDFRRPRRRPTLRHRRQHEVHHPPIGHSSFGGRRRHQQLQRLVGSVLPRLEGHRAWT